MSSVSQVLLSPLSKLQQNNRILSIPIHSVRREWSWEHLLKGFSAHGFIYVWDTMLQFYSLVGSSMIFLLNPYFVTQGVIYLSIFLPQLPKIWDFRLPVLTGACDWGPHSKGFLSSGITLLEHCTKIYQKRALLNHQFALCGISFPCLHGWILVFFFMNSNSIVCFVMIFYLWREKLCV